MQWPLGRPVSAGFENLDDRATKGDLHVVHVGVSSRVSSPASTASPTNPVHVNHQDDFGFPMVNVRRGNSFV